MLIDKYEAGNIFERIPSLTLKLSPKLAAIDQVLDDDEFFAMIRDDLARRRPKTKTVGRHSTPVKRKRKGLPSASTLTWILIKKPPRLRPSAWA